MEKDESVEWEPEEPLLMGKLPDDVDSNPTLAALQSLLYEDEQTPEEVADNFKNKGNELFEKGKKYYKDALQCYTEAINQKVDNPKKRAIYYLNRAAVNLLLENNGRVIEDCDISISLDPTNIKAYFRAAKAALKLCNYDKSISYCVEGLKIEPENSYLQSEKDKAEKSKQSEINKKKHEMETLKQIENEKKALEGRRIVMGDFLIKLDEEYSKSYIDGDDKMHWPVIFIYEEYKQFDIIRDFVEDSTFGDHLQTMFPSDTYADWDIKHEYKFPYLEVYAVLNQVTPLNPAKAKDRNRPKKIKINHNTNLLKVLTHSEYVVPGVPTFYIVPTIGDYKSIFLKLPINELNKI